AGRPVQIQARVHGSPPTPLRSAVLDCAVERCLVNVRDARRRDADDQGPPIPSATRPRLAGGALAAPMAPSPAWPARVQQAGRPARPLSQLLGGQLGPGPA